MPRGRPRKIQPIDNGAADPFDDDLDTPAPIGNRDEIIRQTYQDLAALEAQSKTIREQIKVIKQKRIKADLGMKIVDFNLACRLIDLEGEDRAKALDVIREVHNALGIGETVDWVEALRKIDDEARI